MGLSVSPAIWQTFINKVFNEIPNRKHFLAIMDDCMIHSKRKHHLTHLIALLKALIRNRLKISPRKCQLFRQKLLDEIPNRKHFLAVMDDCMIHSKRKHHLTHLIALLKH